MENKQLRYRKTDLIFFANTLFQKAGMASEMAIVCAETLVEADLMGHTTHGLQLLGPYLDQLEKNGMQKQGTPTVINDFGNAVTWDGNLLPGPWLLKEAMELGIERLKYSPVFTLVIRRSHHIACLAAYLEKATKRDLFILLASSDPANKTVAPFGGLTGTFSPDPIAVGIPTSGLPVLIDISASATANGVVIQKHKNGERLPHPWLIDPEGQPTDDPSVFFKEPPATMMPLGGMDTGYKGFGLALMIEAMTLGLGGFGRSSQPVGWSSGIFLQLIDPAKFGGIDRFKEETSFLYQSCKQSKPIKAEQPVRLPGERALKLKKEQEEKGIQLYPTILPAIQPFCDKYAVPLPEAIR